MLTNVEPKIFYVDLDEGIEFFVEGLRFEVLQRNESMTLVGRDRARAYLVGNQVSAAIEPPKLEIETDDIDAIYEEISTHAAYLLHPGSSAIMRKPWGSREFCVYGRSSVLVTFREWPKKNDPLRNCKSGGTNSRTRRRLIE